MLNNSEVEILSMAKNVLYAYEPDIAEKIENFIVDNTDVKD